MRAPCCSPCLARRNGYGHVFLTRRRRYTLRRQPARTLLRSFPGAPARSPHQRSFCCSPSPRFSCSGVWIRERKAPTPLGAGESLERAATAAANTRASKTRARACKHEADAKQVRLLKSTGCREWEEVEDRGRDRDTKEGRKEGRKRRKTPGFPLLPQMSFRRRHSHALGLSTTVAAASPHPLLFFFRLWSQARATARAAAAALAPPATSSLSPPFLPFAARRPARGRVCKTRATVMK